MKNPFENKTDQELIDLAQEIKEPFISEDSELREIAKEVFGGEVATHVSFLGLSHMLMEVLATRLKAYSPHIEK